MTGPVNSVIGVNKEQIVTKFLTSIPTRFETAKGETIFSGVLLDINAKTGMAKKIQRIQVAFDK
ncbi:hypothetical protein BMS3Bbin09_00044 [bacterium BMS3Bbin09]|nr:hypothetical protein BMS3Bbin09_00044 [bacterium BMS3Bbin09]